MNSFQSLMQTDLNLPENFQTENDDKGCAIKKTIKIILRVFFIAHEISAPHPLSLHTRWKKPSPQNRFESFFLSRTLYFLAVLRLEANKSVHKKFQLGNTFFSMSTRKTRFFFFTQPQFPSKRAQTRTGRGKWRVPFENRFGKTRAKDPQLLSQILT